MLFIDTLTEENLRETLIDVSERWFTELDAKLFSEKKIAEPRKEIVRIAKCLESAGSEEGGWDQHRPEVIDYTVTWYLKYSLDTNHPPTNACLKINVQKYMESITEER